MDQSVGALGSVSAVDLGVYRLGDLIAPGGSSLVFAARREGLPFQGQWRVVLKCVWRVALARREAAHLVDLNAVDGVVTLLDYREVPFQTIVDHLAAAAKPSLTTCDLANIRDRYDLSADSPVGVLVLQFQAGAPLVSGTEPIAEPVHEDTSSLWVKDLESGRWLRQRLHEDLCYVARLRLLQQLAAQVAICHRRGVVHGDLKPHNILFDREMSRLTLVDFGGDTSLTRGSPGWQAPEHFQVALGKRTRLPPTADVFVLGLFIHRLLTGQMPKRLRLLVDNCLAPAEQRPTANTIATELTAIIAAQRLGWQSWMQKVAWAASAMVPFGLWLLLAMVPPPGQDVHATADVVTMVPFDQTAATANLAASRTEPESQKRVPSQSTDFLQTRAIAKQDSAWSAPAIQQSAGDVLVESAEASHNHPGLYFLLPSVDKRPTRPAGEALASAAAVAYIVSGKNEPMKPSRSSMENQGKVAKNPLHDLAKERLVLAVDSTLQKAAVTELSASLERHANTRDRLTLMNQQLDRQLADIANEARVSQAENWFRLLDRPYDGFRSPQLPSNWPPRQNIDQQKDNFPR